MIDVFFKDSDQWFIIAFVIVRETLIMIISLQSEFFSAQRTLLEFAKFKETITISVATFNQFFGAGFA